MATRLLVAGYFYNTAKSNDGGLTWQYGELPEVNGLPLANGGPCWALTASPTKYLATPIFWDYWETGLPNDPNQVAVSTDGLTWSQRTIGAVTYKLSTPSWTGTRFVVVDNNKAFHSADGDTWAESAIGFSVSFASNDLTPITAVVGSRVIAVWPNFSSSKIAYSDDHGSTWVDATPAELALYISYLRVVGTTVYLASGRRLLQSTDSGATWTALQEDNGITTPATDFGPLAKIGTSFFTPGMGYAGGSYNPDANKGRQSSTPETAPWDVITHSLDANFIYSGAQTSTTAYFVGGHQTADGNGFYQPLLASSTDGLTYSPITFPAAAVTNPGDGWLYLTDVLAIEYTPAPGFDGHFDDGITLSDALGTNAQQVFADMVDALNTASNFGESTRISAAIMDMVILFSDGSVAWPVSASLDETLHLSDGGTQGSFDPYDAINNPTQFAVDPVTGAVSIYTGYDFDQYASVGQDLYAVRADGVYLLRGADDAGQLINAGVDLGASSFGTTRAKNIEAVYLGLETDGEVYVRVAAAGGERIYRVVKRGPLLRALCAKGVTDRTWGVKIDIEQATAADMDVVEIFTGINSRRWTR